MLAGEDLAVSLLRGNWTYWPSLAFRTEAVRRQGFIDDLPADPGPRTAGRPGSRRVGDAGAARRGASPTGATRRARRRRPWPTAAGSQGERDYFAIAAGDASARGGRVPPARPACTWRRGSTPSPSCPGAVRARVVGRGCARSRVTRRPPAADARDDAASGAPARVEARDQHRLADLAAGSAWRCRRAAAAPGVRRSRWAMLPARLPYIASHRSCDSTRCGGNGRTVVEGVTAYAHRAAVVGPEAGDDAEQVGHPCGPSSRGPQPPVGLAERPLERVGPAEGREVGGDDLVVAQGLDHRVAAAAGATRRPGRTAARRGRGWRATACLEGPDVAPVARGSRRPAPAGRATVASTRQRVVGGGVVDDDHLVGRAELGEDRVELLDDMGGPVVGRHRDGDLAPRGAQASRTSARAVRMRRPDAQQPHHVDDEPHQRERDPARGRPATPSSRAPGAARRRRPRPPPSRRRTRSARRAPARRHRSGSGRRCRPRRA